MWQDVCDRYNSMKNERAPYRDYDAIKNKFKGLKSHKKPTGDPECPPLVRRAKQLDKEIQTGLSVINLGSDNESSIHDAQGSESEELIVSGSVSVDDDHLNSPVSTRAGLTSFIASSARIVIEETMPPNVVLDSLPNSQLPSHNVPVDDEDGIDNDKDKRGALPQNQDESSGILEDKRKYKVPFRLGKDAGGLNLILGDVLEKNREAEKQRKRKSVPENPNHSKKKSLSKEIQDIDEDFASAKESNQRNFALQQKAMELRHIEEMTRLDQQNAVQERRFEVESQRHQSMMMMMFAAITGNRAALAPPVQPASPNSDSQP